MALTKICHHIKTQAGENLSPQSLMKRDQGKPRLHSLPPTSDVQHNEWYIGEYGRQAVEEALTKEDKDGTFLVRDCSKKSKAEPYVLVVFYGKKVYNVKIRFLERYQQFALGTGLRGDESPLLSKPSRIGICGQNKQMRMEDGLEKANGE
ncbi:Cytokine-dependent hematopoietic cell linker [Tupaia chinensis]|uniref:Cytokine-dependent hematopoietic cell linker n=1 Tax=Tupaia chinensis TaxID=246437 RepID=L8Y962_TUPCH|nr:Cytokine-dependent hematopoietic cell linker [Tupaia chinensis]